MCVAMAGDAAVPLPSEAIGPELASADLHPDENQNCDGSGASSQGDDEADPETPDEPLESRSESLFVNLAREPWFWQGQQPPTRGDAVDPGPDRRV